MPSYDQYKITSVKRLNEKRKSFKESISDSSWLSTEGSLISALAVSHYGFKGKRRD